MENGEALHIVWYGTFSEKQYFLNEYLNKYDLIGFNANIIAYAPNAIGAFVSNLTNKRFFIDPQTYAFQETKKSIKKKKEGEIVLKKSVANLAEVYGSIIKKFCTERKLSASDFTDGNIKELSKNILDFELNIIKNIINESDVKEFLGDDIEHIDPAFLIAPYFYFTADNIESTAKLNRKFCETSIDIINHDVTINKPLFAQVVVDKEILSDSSLSTKVLECYKKLPIDGFTLWINNFAEQEVSEHFLTKYIEFIKEINPNKKPIIALHGSYFSIVLSSKDYKYLAGVGHGIEYGESRPINPVGGGIPTSKFYFPKFYERVDHNPDAIETLIELDCLDTPNDYYKKVCDCPMCKSIIVNDVMDDFDSYGKGKRSEKNPDDERLYPTGTAMELTRKHFLHNKYNEHKFCKLATKKEIIEKLNKSLEFSNQVISYPFDHVERWNNVLKNLK